MKGLVTNPTATAYNLTQTGTLSLNAYSGGGYWTHYGPEGWYLDGVLQGTGYVGSATAQFPNLGLSTSLPTGGYGFIASLEGGYPIPLALGSNFILEPQGQIIWQHVSLDRANDGLSTVGLGSTSGWTGRLGVRAQWTIPGEDGAVWQPYGRFNVWRDWGASAKNELFGRCCYGAAARGGDAAGVRRRRDLQAQHQSELLCAGRLSVRGQSQQLPP